MGITFVVEPVTVDESLTPGLQPASQTITIARRKLDAYLSGLPPAGPRAGRWALAADTMVCLDGRLIGKPANEAEAAAILAGLSGKTHQVITGVVLYNPVLSSIASGSVTTEVTFGRLSRAEIDWYLSTGEWKEVAGGYRIQQKGTVLIESVAGSYSNVVGLPTRALYGMLQAQGYPDLPKGS